MNRTNTVLWESMNADLDRILGRMEKDHEMLERSPGEGRWSPIQVLYHLYTSELLSLKYLRKKTQAPPSQLKTASWRTKLRKALLKFYLASPFKFKAPKMVSLSDKDEAPSFETLQSNYRSLRKEMKDFLDQLSSDFEDRELYRHPIAGRMNLNGMLTFMEKHLLRHEKQIEETIRDLS